MDHNDAARYYFARATVCAVLSNAYRKIGLLDRARYYSQSAIWCVAQALAEVATNYAPPLRSPGETVADS